MGYGASTYGIGWTYKQVRLTEVDFERGLAIGKDTEGVHVEIQTSFQRTGIRPQVGQVWIVDRDLGRWSLTALLKAHHPASAVRGVVTLAAGTATVSTPVVAEDSVILLTAQGPGGTAGHLSVSARVPGSRFTISSTSGSDVRPVGWMIVDGA